MAEDRLLRHLCEPAPNVDAFLAKVMMISAKKRMKSCLTCAFLVFFTFLFSACANKELIRTSVPLPYNGPVSVDVLKKAIGFGDIKTIKALADVRVLRQGEPAGSFSGVFGYQAPASLKTSFFGPFGLTVMEMLVTDDMIQVYLPQKNTVYEKRSPGISFTSVVNGRFIYTIDEEDDFYSLFAFAQEDTTAGPVMKYIFDRTCLLNRRIVIYTDGKEALRIDFDGFNGKAPEKARLTISNGTVMEIALHEAEYNTDIPEEYFEALEQGDRNILPFQDLLEHFGLQGRLDDGRP
jgi:hypothetical protein